MAAVTSRNDANTAVLVERLSNLQGDIAKIDSGINDIGERFMTFEKSYLLEHAKVANRADDAHQKLVDQNDRIKTLETEFKKLSDMIQPLITTNKAVVWIGGVLGVSALGLVWSVMTGQVVLLFK